MSQEGVEAVTSMGTSQNIIHPTIISFDDKYCHNKKIKTPPKIKFYKKIVKKKKKKKKKNKIFLNFTH
jgi:hypothetical protein